MAERRWSWKRASLGGVIALVLAVVGGIVAGTLEAEAAVDSSLAESRATLLATKLATTINCAAFFAVIGVAALALLFGFWRRKRPR